MKRLKEFLDLLISISKAWPIVVSVSLAALALIIRLSKLAKQNVVLSLPLWALVLFVALAFYPVGRTIQFVVSQKKASLKPLNGLLWKIPIFGLPRPICPYEGCGREVICKEIPPPPFRVVTGISDLQTAKFEYSYQYECPVHGLLQGVPNEPIGLLREKARLAFK